MSLWCALALSPAHAFGQARNWPSEDPPPPLAARQVKFPPYEIRTLANGLQVVVVLHHEQPAVSLRLLVRSGAAYDPPGKPGVATLAAALLDQGTTTRTAAQIADTIDTIGGLLSIASGSDLTFISVMVMKDSFNLGLELLSDVARNPAFAKEEIERQRQQALSAMKVSYEDPDYVAGSVFDRLVYGFHPYGTPNNGTPATVEKITRDDLHDYHRRYFAPNNSLLAIVGDVTAQEAFAAAERVLGNWPKKDLLLPKLPEPPPPTRRVIAVNKPDAVQTEVRVGHIGIPRKHPDYMPLDLAIRILGGEGANRLHRVLRTERGLTYGASADLQTLKYTGDFVADTDTRSEATGEVLRLIVDEVFKLQRERVGERELADAQAYLAGSFPLTIETPDAIATQVLNALFFELPLEELQTFRERVNAVTPDDIQRVARQFLKPDRLSVALVGNVDAFKGQLPRVGFSNVETVQLSDLDLTSVDFKKGGQSALRAPGAASVLAAPAAAAGNNDAPQAPDTDARALISKAVDAKGGLEKLRSIKTVVAEAKTKVIGPQGPVEAETRTYIEYPNRFRVDAKLAGIGQLVQTYDDGRAWMQDPGGVRDAPDPIRDEFGATVRRELIPLLISAASGELRLRALADVKEDGAALHPVEVSSETLGPVTLYLDKVGTIVRQTFTRRGPTGPETVNETFTDYRSIDGVQVAFKAVVRHGETVALERTITDFKVNVPIDPVLFKKPS